MSNTTYYQKDRNVILNRAKDYYKNDKERLNQQARDKYRNLFEKDKNKKTEEKKETKKRNIQRNNIKKITVRLKNLNLIINTFYGFNSVCYVLIIRHQIRNIYVI